MITLCLSGSNAVFEIAFIIHNLFFSFICDTLPLVSDIAKKQNARN